jgi:iron complex transport system permease protein
MKKNRIFLLITLLAIVWFVTLVVCSMFGAVSNSFANVWHLWMGGLAGESDTAVNTSQFSLIYWNIRMPRLILASLAGAALAVAGAAFQAIFKNPMADPYVLGVSSGASLGATLAIVLGFEAGMLGTTGFAFLFALATVLVVYYLAFSGSRLDNQVLLLSGISLSFLMSALVSLMMVIHREMIEKIIFWTLGGFNIASWEHVVWLLPIVFIGISVIYFFSRNLNIMLLGADAAPTLGVNPARTTRIILVVCSLMVASVVANSGVIGFAGLIVPHFVRLFTGSDNRVVIPVSIFTGAIFLIISDTLARTLVSPSELPVGSITALFGVPYFLFLLYKSRQKV